MSAREIGPANLNSVVIKKNLRKDSGPVQGNDFDEENVRFGGSQSRRLARLIKGPAQPSDRRLGSIFPEVRSSATVRPSLRGQPGDIG